MLPIILAVVVLALDQWTKHLVAARMTEFVEVPIIPGFFSLQWVHNPGAAFGILAGQQWIFVVVASLTILGILWFTRQPDGKVGLIPWALGLLLGGAAGNLVDRIRFGEVVDFFLFYWRDWYFPNFNVADIGITVGVGLFILQMLLTGEKQRREGA